MGVGFVCFEGIAARQINILAHVAVRRALLQRHARWARYAHMRARACARGAKAWQWLSTFCAGVDNDNGTEGMHGDVEKRLDAKLWAVCKH